MVAGEARAMSSTSRITLTPVRRLIVSPLERQSLRESSRSEFNCDETESQKYDTYENEEVESRAYFACKPYAK